MGGEHRGFHALSDPSARTARRAFFLRQKDSNGEAWNQVVAKLG